LCCRYGVFKDYVDKISEIEGGLEKFTSGYKKYGMIFNRDNSVLCREWAPGAQQVHLMGDFSMLYYFYLIKRRRKDLFPSK